MQWVEVLGVLPWNWLPVQVPWSTVPLPPPIYGSKQVSSDDTGVFRVVWQPCLSSTRWGCLVFFQGVQVGAISWGSKITYKSLGCLIKSQHPLTLGFWVAKQVSKAGTQAMEEHYKKQSLKVQFRCLVTGHEEESPKPGKQFWLDLRKWQKWETGSTMKYILKNWWMIQYKWGRRERVKGDKYSELSRKLHCGDSLTLLTQQSCNYFSQHSFLSNIPC